MYYVRHYTCTGTLRHCTRHHGERFHQSIALWHHLASVHPDQSPLSYQLHNLKTARGSNDQAAGRKVFDLPWFLFAGLQLWVTTADITLCVRAHDEDGQHCADGIATER